MILEMLLTACGNYHVSTVCCLDHDMAKGGFYLADMCHGPFGDELVMVRLP